MSYSAALEQISTDADQKFHDLAVKFAGIMEMVEGRQWLLAANTLSEFTKECYDVDMCLFMIAAIRDDGEEARQ